MDIDNFLNQHEQKDLLRFLTCGSVDDGKSTLIGRLLYDSKLIFDDQLIALRKDSDKNGTTGTGEIDYALLLDGLKAEREQGITIDVAYRYFSTPKRKFIIADTPGHEQYTRNMATGASTANLAIILIDARYGVVTQTKRHAFIISLLGIKHLVVAVNKMDIVGYDQDVFNSIRKEFTQFTSQLQIPDITFIPLSALKGENVVAKSPRMPWYDGVSLLEFLETVNISNDNNLDDFRFPVQYVIRPHLDFRGFAGSVYSGVVKVGDRVRALPSQKESAIKNIVTADGDLKQAFPPQTVTLELEDEIDISSGDMIVHADNVPRTSNVFESELIWMTEEPLQKGLTYLLRHAGRNVKARVDDVIYNIDVNTLEKRSSETLKLNEIGRVAVTTTKPLYFDAYSKNRGTGSFILIHPITNTTVGAGMILERSSYDSKDSEAESGDTAVRHELSWEKGLVDVRERETRNRHKGRAVVVTGVNAESARELAKRLEQHLFRHGINSYYLSLSRLNSTVEPYIDNRHLNRDEQICRLGELSHILTEAGIIFVTALSEVNDHDLKRLKSSASGNGIAVVNLGDSAFKEIVPDINLNAESALEANLSQTLSFLSAKNIIPEDCI